MYFDRRLFGLTRGLRWRIALTAIIGLIAVPVAIWRLVLTGSTIAQVFAGQTVASLVGVLVLIAVLLFVRAGLEYVRDEIASKTAAIMKVRVRRLLYDQVLRLGPGHFDQKRTGEAVLSLVEGVEQLEVFYGRYLPQIVVAALTPIIIFAFMAFLDVQTALIFLFFALFTLIAPAWFHGLNARSSLLRRQTWAALGSDFLDNLQGLPTLKIFGQSGRRGDALAERARHVYKSTMGVLAANITTGGITLVGISAGAAVALAWGAVRVEAGDLDLRTLLIVLLLGVEVFRPLRDLTVLYHQGMLAVAATQAIFELLDTVPEVQEPAGAEAAIRRVGETPPASALSTSVAASEDAPPDATTPAVRFENVTFGYNSGRRPALREFSFDLRPGETLGVVGPSGAGKSTIVNLLLRFVDPQSGRVLLGGRDVRDLSFATLRQQVAVVTQDTYLFHGTVAENLRLGRPAATDAELERAARLANAHDFILALPQGYDTVVGERGARLSGGQRQRIAIARALLKDAPILVLDEALSSVDAENESVIQEALERLQAGRTTLVIAHRLSSVVNADRIIVLNRGHLVETGRHTELMAAGGLYARLMAAQHELEVDRAAGAIGLTPAPSRARDEAGDTGSGGAGAVALAGADPHAVTPAAPATGTDGAGPDLAPARAALPMSALWPRLFALVAPWRGEWLLTLVLGLLHSISGIALGAVGALLVGRVVTGGDTGPLIVLLLALVPVAAVLQWLDVFLAHDLAYRLLAEMRIALYRLLEPLAPAYLLRRRSGDLASTGMGDVELIELFYAHTISPLFQGILVPAGVLIALAVIAWPLALVLLPFLIIVALTPLVAGRAMERLGGDLREHTGLVQAHMVDSVQGLRTIAAFAAGASRSDEIAANGTRLGELKQRFGRHQSFQNAAIETLIGLGGLAVLAVGASLVSAGQMQRVDLPLATLLAFSAFGPVVNIVVVAKELMQTVGASRRYFAIEDEPVLVRDGAGAALPATNAGVRGLPVAFEGVTFRYGPAERPALQAVSFRAEAGQTVALVGRSGAGKTTAAHLLLRYWDPEAGSIQIAGRDLRDFPVDDLRRQIGLVAQDTYLFNTTLWENLYLGNPDATDDQVREAARLANVEEFASGLPDGYQTLVGERGMQLSGGQRQRVAIARALLKDAPVLVLDEATSHLDAVNEAEVREALGRLMAGRTTLVIAHRLSTIRDADRIVVLDAGKVKEHGTHGELLAQDGLYSHLIAAQLMGRSGRGAPAAAPTPAGEPSAD